MLNLKTTFSINFILAGFALEISEIYSEAVCLAIFANYLRSILSFQQLNLFFH